MCCCTDCLCEVCSICGDTARAYNAFSHVYLIKKHILFLACTILKREPASPCTSRSSPPVGIKITEAAVDQPWQVEQEQEEWVRPRCCCTYIPAISSIVRSISVCKRKVHQTIFAPHIMVLNRTTEQ